jgi:RimJ/RimL family protein N-acetyltransferase
MPRPGFDPLPTLVGERVRLRPVVAADAPALLEVFGDPEVARYLGIPLLRRPAEARRMAEEIRDGARSGELLQWAITAKDDDRLLGTCSLARISWNAERAEVGFAIGAAHWGRRLASAAVPLVVDFAFAELGFHRLEADVDPRNEASLRLLERLGFRREGHLRERHKVGDERQDSVMLGLLAPEWHRRRNR